MPFRKHMAVAVTVPSTFRASQRKNNMAAVAEVNNTRDGRNNEETAQFLQLAQGTNVNVI